MYVHNKLLKLFTDQEIGLVFGPELLMGSVPSEFTTSEITGELHRNADNADHVQVHG